MRPPLALTALVLALTAACSSSGGAAATPGPASAAAPNAPTKPNPGESDPSKVIPKDEATQIVVGVATDDFAAQGYQLTAIRIEAKVDGLIAASETLDLTSDVVPHETRIVAPKDTPEASVEIVASALTGASVVATRRATAQFVKGSTKLVYVLLEARCNSLPLPGGGAPAGPTCTNPGETCIGGKCHTEALSDLPDYHADWAKSPPSQCGAGTASTIVLGQGRDAVTPLNDGDAVTVECGPQGGHHLWVALAMTNLSQVGTITTLSATQPGTALSVPATAYPYAWAPGDAAACDLVGVRFQIDLGGTNIADFLGKPLDITVEAQDKSGRKASATKRVNVSSERHGDFCMPLGGPSVP